MSESLKLSKINSNKDSNVRPDELIDPFEGLNDTIIQLAPMGNVDDMATENS